MTSWCPRHAFVLALASAWLSASAHIRAEVAGGLPFVTLNDNGAWCWFQDERAVIHDGKLFVGSVAHSAGAGGADRHGNVEVVEYEFSSGRTHRFVLHGHLEADDHNTAALLVRPDQRLIAVYAKHGTDPLVRFRISVRPSDASEWHPEATYKARAGVTYSNVFRLANENSGQGRTYNFYRGEGRLPAFLVSDDDGTNWSFGGQLLHGPSWPYLKYASNHVDEVHFITTDRHPRWCDNSIYHAYIKNGNVCQSNGTPVGDLRHGPIRASDTTRVFAGDEDHNAWTSDLHLDAEGHPYCVFSVRRDGAGKRNGEGGRDFRYHYARYIDGRWHEHEIAYGGTCLYSPEDHYTGNIAADPDNPDVVYISTDVDPVTGRPQPNGHYEIYRGRTEDQGATWRWSPITSNSSVDNLRPIVPKSDGRNTALLWLSGTYTTYTDYNLAVVGIVRQTYRQEEPRP